MGAASPQGPQDMITGINVTPLVDITLVLLIVFMVTATYIVKAAIEVALPEAQTGDAVAGQMLTVVVKQQDAAGGIKRDGPCTVFALDGEVMAEAALARALGQAQARDAATKVMISADRDCRHSEFVHVMDLVKTQGITKFAINIERMGAVEASP